MIRRRLVAPGLGHDQQARPDRQVGAQGRAIAREPAVPQPVVYASNNLANRVLEWTFSIVIPRARLRGGPAGTGKAGSPHGTA